MSQPPTQSSYDALLAAAARADVPVTLSTGAEVLVRGLTVMEFVRVIRDHHQVRDLILGMVGAGDEVEDSSMLADVMSAFVDAGPEAIASLIAASLGLRQTDAAERVLALGDEDFFALLEKSVELTMPRGAGDFFGRLGGVMGKLGLAVSDRGRPSAEAA